MTKLKELSEYKNTIIQRILGNQNIVKALYYQDKNFHAKPDVEDVSTLNFSNIYPYNFIPSSDEELKLVKSYVTLSITDYRPAKSIHFYAGNIFIYVFMHKDLFRTDYDYLRTDYIASEIHELLDKKRGIGIGELQFVGAKEYSLNPDYHGIWLQYRPVDFN